MAAGDSNSPVFDFTTADYPSCYADLERFAISRFPTELWTDFNASNTGTYHLELMSYVFDLGTYQRNASVLESVPILIRREQNFRNATKTFDFKMSSAAPAVTKLMFYNLPAGHVFTSHTHIQVADSNGYVFQPTEEKYVDTDLLVVDPTYGRYYEVTAEQGAEYFQSATGNGSAKQEIQLTQLWVIDGSILVTVNGTTYTEVTNIIEAGPTQPVYIWESDDQGNTTIIFGDGTNGSVPNIGADIQIRYKVGGGIETNVPTGAITSIYGSSYPTVYPLPTALQDASVRNSEAAVDGGPRQTLAQAKAILPGSIRANHRCVNLLDYPPVAKELVPNILHCIALDGKAIGGTVPVLLFVVPQGGGAVTSALRNVIVNALSPYKMSSKRVYVRDGYYVYLDIVVDAYCKDSALAAEVKSRVSSVLASAYSLSSMAFGSLLDLQAAYDRLSPSLVAGLRRVYFEKFSIVPTAGTHINTTNTGDGTIGNIVIDEEEVLRREWLVRIGPTPTQYTVLERQIGNISYLTDSTVTDEAASYDSNELAGWAFHPVPEIQPDTRIITDNTATSFTTVGGNFVLATPGDPYVVERTAGTGKAILSTSTAVAVVGASTITVDSTVGWVAGDRVILTSGSYTLTTTVQSIGAGTVVLNAVVTELCPVGTTLHYMWQDSNATVSFAVAPGPTAFATNDELYVDTFRKSADIQVRGEQFIRYSVSNIVVNTIGGVK